MHPAALRQTSSTPVHSRSIHCYISNLNIVRYTRIYAVIKWSLVLSNRNKSAIYMHRIARAQIPNEFFVYVHTALALNVHSFQILCCKNSIEQNGRPLLSNESVITFPLQRITQSNTRTVWDSNLYSVRLEVSSVQEISVATDSSYDSRMGVQCVNSDSSQ
jgi:hypothetical protein